MAEIWMNVCVIIKYNEPYFPHIDLAALFASLDIHMKLLQKLPTVLEYLKSL